MKDTQWGILSTGDIAHQFAGDLAHASRACGVAVASRSLDKARAFAGRFGLDRAYDDFGAMLADPEIDAVYIGTPHTLHHENAAEAIRAGKAVLCEKPMTTGAAETEALCALAREKNVFLMEGMWTWFLPAVQTARRWIHEGRIGPLRHIRADFGFSMLPYDPSKRVYNADLGASCMLDLGIYPIALCRFFLNTDPESIQATGRFAPNGVEDEVEMLFQYPDAITASLGCSFRATQFNHAILSGEEGQIILPRFFGATECHWVSAGGRHREIFTDTRSSLGYHYEAEAASTDLREGKTESDTVTHADSMAFQRQIDQVRQVIR